MLSAHQKIEVEALLRKVGDECILKYFRNISESDISFKQSKFDPVTIADKEAEALLFEGLLRILPNSLFIGEESYAIDKSLLGHLEQTSKPVWVADPIDGTSNFVAGKLGFGIMVCLIDHGQTIASWLYEVNQKRMTTFYAPDILLENGVLFPHHTTINHPYRGIIGRKLHRFPIVQKLKDTTSDIIVDAATDPSIITYHDYLMGKTDFLIFKLTSPWDHLPGLAMIQSRGGIAQSWSGEPFQNTDLNKGLVIARNQDVMNLVMKNLIIPLRESAEITI